MPHIRNHHEFGKFLQAYRYHKRISQRDLTKVLGAGKCAISHFENNKKKASPDNPTYRAMIELVGNDAYLDMPSNEQMLNATAAVGRPNQKLFYRQRGTNHPNQHTKPKPPVAVRSSVIQQPNFYPVVSMPKPEGLQQLLDSFAGIKDLMAKRRVLNEQIQKIDEQIQKILG